MNVLVLAGAQHEGFESKLPAGAYRAGLQIGGRSMLETAFSAIASLPDRGRVVLVGPGELAPPGGYGLPVEVLPPAGDLLDNLRRGLAALPREEQVLVMAADQPLLTRAALEDFLANCRRRTADIYYPIIRREVYEAAYPGSVRTYLRVRDGMFTGGNVVLLTPAVFTRHEGLIARAVAGRKHPWRLGRLLGPGFLLGLLFRRYTVAQIEERVAVRLGLRGAAVESRFSEMGFDVDSDADMEWIQFYWGGTLEGAVRKEPQSNEE